MNTILRYTRLTTLLVAAALMTGCTTSGRYVVFKEFSSPRSSQENSPLKGHTVCVKPFADAFNIEDKLPDKREMTPKNYVTVKTSREEEKMWDDEVNQRKKTGTEADWLQIGSVRNQYGMKMGKVYALDDPGVGLADMLKADLQKLGAHVVDASQEADAEISVGGTIKYLISDNYSGCCYAYLEVDVQLKPRAQAATTRSFYTGAKQVNWTHSNSEHYQPLRRCQQKFSRLVIADMEQLVKE